MSGAAAKRIVPSWSHCCKIAPGSSLGSNVGSACEELIVWCEVNGVDFLFGLAKNDRLNAMIKNELEQAAATSQRTGKPARRFNQSVRLAAAANSHASRV